MKYIFKYSAILFYSFVLLSNAAKAQSIAKAEKKYQNLGYMNAVETYKKAGIPADSKNLRQIANAYLKNGEYATAATYFKQLINTQSTAEDKLNYAQCLLASGDCTDAISWYNQYKTEAGTTAENTSFIEDCSEISKLQHKNIKVDPLEGINTDQSDFSAIPYNGGIVFTSSRGDNQKCKDNWTGKGYSDIYFAVLSGNKAAQIVPILGETNQKFHDGTACFNKDRNTMYFTRSSAYREDSGIRNLNLYSTTKKSGVWTEPKKLSVNIENFSSAHPTLSANGNSLYFASDRPGGKGGMDIWRSDWKDNEWSAPKNLATINTTGNEIFPFVNSENELFYSSNGHKGLGGLDVFKYDGQKISNMGAPINSSFDDFSYVELNKEKGYLSSSRKGGLGGDDDIYQWKNIPEDVTEKEKSLAQKMEELRIKEKELELEKDKLRVLNQELAEKLKKDCGTNIKPKTQKVKIEVLDAYSEAPLILPLVTIHQKQEQIISAQKNQFEIEIDPLSTYTFKVENDGYETSIVSIEGNELIRNPNYHINLLKNNTPIFDGKIIKKGKTITINDIYYDYNKYDIRSEATPGLDRLAEVMLKYPTIELELSSHTDCRGKAESNEKLSQQRAEEATKYLISRGVAARRMIARGYGESKPVNTCVDGVTCSEEEHQKNRRTEIKILRFETEDLEVIKGDN